jgi:hypothetical protein
MVFIINYALHHEDVWKSGGVAPSLLAPILDGDEWSASRTLHPPLYLWRKSPQYALYGRFRRFESRSGLCGYGKISFSCRKSNPDSSVVQPVAQSQYRLIYNGSEISL